MTGEVGPYTFMFKHFSQRDCAPAPTYPMDAAFKVNMRYDGYIMVYPCISISSNRFVKGFL